MSAGGYAEAYDPRVSGRVSLQHLRQSNAASLPSDLLFAVLLSKSLVALALHVANDWLVAQGYSPWTIAALVQGAGGVVLALWERPWEASRGGKRRTEPSSPLYPVLFALETLFALLSISHLSVLRFILLTAFAPLWARGLPFVKASSRKVVERGNAFSLTTAMVVIAYLADSTLSTGSNRTGYIYLLLHLLACGQRSEMFAGFDGDEQQKGRMHANGAVAAAFVAGVIAFLRLQFGPTASTLTSSSSSPLAGPETSSALALLGIGLLGVTFICVDPLLTRSLLTHFPPLKLLSTGWPISAFATAFVGYVGFDRGIGWGEAAVVVIGWKGGVSTGSSAPNQSFPARFATFYRHFRATIKTILASPESRRIYFFLCLNLGFMFIQMAYGIWTNSLGLISDSIHMFFDCLALAMGLFASVMATWPSNDSFTYGYTRVETLSGFANGIFLCLISIFIVFEAIERLIDPPEMNTGQLLTVSAVGLAVNLVGMVATGHAHGGHSHGGGGGHSHGHSHAPVKSKITPFLTEKEEEEEDHHGHSHVMADTLGSVGVIISTLLINRYGWTGFDPLASIFIAVLIFASVVPLVVDSGKLLMLDMGEEQEADVRKALTADPSSMVGSICVQLAPSAGSTHGSAYDSHGRPTHQHFADCERVRARVRRTLRANIAGLDELTVQVEPTSGLG
ncbi:hypothetical protein Rhopal_003408-T1 [Rhodotorula paludigena]|uniref:Cation efflux protein transmembrane domain-containing protein n=1 Tax=Rhodotorula paludigena TaxID=86838 RepID=A0AAV5GMY6_9BASI|nr:hypothetical protein Rhopal_003408-T1 [Rhodotorula paludigena]